MDSKTVPRLRRSFISFYRVFPASRPGLFTAIHYLSGLTYRKYKNGRRGPLGFSSTRVSRQELGETSAEGAMQWWRYQSGCLMTSIYLELETEPLRRPFRAFCNLDLEPGLAPWAVLLDPF